jgi:hypothetical protein
MANTAPAGDTPPAAGARANDATAPRGDSSEGAAQSAEQDDDAVDSTVPNAPLPKPPESSRWLLMGVGVGTTALWYAGALGLREMWPSQAHRTDLQIPVAGPFMDLTHTGCPSWNTGCSKFQLVVRTLLVTLDAIGQAGGVALVLQGAVLSTSSGESPARSMPSAGAPVSVSRSTTRRRSERSVSAVPMPWFDETGGGIGIVGQF